MTDLPKQTIADLLNQIGQRDDKAATRLYRHYHGYLYAFVRHRLADDFAAEEIVNDVFLAACRKPEAFSGNSAFSTWLCAIARFKVADWMRKKGRSVPVEDTDDETIEAQPDPHGDFVGQIETLENEQAIRDCIDALPVAHREAIFWVYYEDKGLNEVAALQECPPGTVKSRLFNSRIRLRNCLDQRGAQ